MTRRENIYTGAVIGIMIAYVGITLWQTNHPKIEMVPIEIQAPVMARIAECESSDSQMGTNGQLNINVNKDGTVDIGVYQINSDWFVTATKMGLNLANEKDNRTFALWLYKNHGTGAWSSSEKCWDK